MSDAKPTPEELFDAAKQFKSEIDNACEIAYHQPDGYAEEMEQKLMLLLRAAAMFLACEDGDLLDDGDRQTLQQLRDEGAEAFEDNIGELPFPARVTETAEAVYKRAMWKVSQSKAAARSGTASNGKNNGRRGTADPLKSIARFQAALCALQWGELESSSVRLPREPHIQTLKDEGRAIVRLAKQHGITGRIDAINSHLEPQDLWPDDTLVLELLLSDVEDEGNALDNTLRDEAVLLDLVKEELRIIVGRVAPESLPEVPPPHEVNEMEWFADSPQWQEWLSIEEATAAAVGPLPCDLSDLREDLFPQELNEVNDLIERAEISLYEVAWRGSERSSDGNWIHDALEDALRARGGLLKAAAEVAAARAALAPLAEKLAAAHRRLGVQLPAFLEASGASAHEALLNWLQDQLGSIASEWKDKPGARIYTHPLVGDLDVQAAVREWRRIRPATQGWYKWSRVQARGLKQLLEAERFVATREFWPDRLASLVITSSACASPPARRQPDMAITSVEGVGTSLEPDAVRVLDAEDSDLELPHDLATAYEAVTDALDQLQTLEDMSAHDGPEVERSIVSNFLDASSRLCETHERARTALGKVRTELISAHLKLRAHPPIPGIVRDDAYETALYIRQNDCAHGAAFNLVEKALGELPETGYRSVDLPTLKRVWDKVQDVFPVFKVMYLDVHVLRAAMRLEAVMVRDARRAAMTVSVPPPAQVPQPSQHRDQATPPDPARVLSVATAIREKHDRRERLSCALTINGDCETERERQERERRAQLWQEIERLFAVCFRAAQYWGIEPKPIQEYLATRGHYNPDHHVAGFPDDTLSEVEARARLEMLAPADASPSLSIPPPAGPVATAPVPLTSSAAVATRAGIERPQAKGPLPPDRFSYIDQKGAEQDLDGIQNLPWRLLDCLWKNRVQQEEAVIEYVWGAGRTPSKDAVQGAVRRANDVLLECLTGLQVTRKNGYFELS
jgi:hypothetical protein